MSHEEMHCLRTISYANFQIVVIYVSATWLLKTSRTTNFSEQEKLLLAELGKDFPEVESKGYDSKTLTKKAKAWEEILTRFNSQIPNGIKRDLSQLQGCWRRLKLQSKKEHDLIVEKQEKLVEEKLPPPQVK